MSCDVPHLNSDFEITSVFPGSKARSTWASRERDLCWKASSYHTCYRVHSIGGDKGDPKVWAVPAGFLVF